MKVGPITPAFTNPDGSAGGYSEAQLRPSADDGATEILYELVGTHAGEYALVSLLATAPFSSWVVLRRRVTTP